MGNTVIWKPASSAMLSGYYTLKCLEAAGLPPGVINFLPGDARQITTALLDSPEFGGVHFTGSIDPRKATKGRRMSKKTRKKPSKASPGKSGRTSAAKPSAARTARGSKASVKKPAAKAGKARPAKAAAKGAGKKPARRPKPLRPKRLTRPHRNR